MRSVYGFDSSRLYNKSRCDLATYRQCLMIWHFRPTLGVASQALTKTLQGQSQEALDRQL